MHPWYPLCIALVWIFPISCGEFAAEGIDQKILRNLDLYSFCLMVTCAARWNVLGGRQGGCWGWGGGQVSEAVVLSTIILLRIYCSKALAMNLRLFSKSSDVFGTLRRIGRTILPGEKAIGPRSSAQASILWKAERHVWHSCTYFPLFQNTKGCNLCTVLNDSHIFLQQIAHIILSCTAGLSSWPKWIPWIRSALMNQTPLQERKMAFF